MGLNDRLNRLERMIGREEPRYVIVARDDEEPDIPPGVETVVFRVVRPDTRDEEANGWG
jgi:hypothetical protein